MAKIWGIVNDVCDNRGGATQRTDHTPAATGVNWATFATHSEKSLIINALKNRIFILYCLLLCFLYIFFLAKISLNQVFKLSKVFHAFF